MNQVNSIPSSGQPTPASTRAPIWGEWSFSPRRELLYLALAAMDLSVLMPLLLVASQYGARFTPQRAAPTFFIIVLLAFNLVRLLDALNFRDRIQRDIGLGVLILWIFLALRFILYRHYPLFSLGWVGEMVEHFKAEKLWVEDVTIIFAVLVFWWRGLILAGRNLGVQSVAYHFRAGVLIEALVVSLVSRLTDWSPIPYVLGFFFFSLVAIALARAEEVGRWRSGLPFPFSIGWLGSITAAAGTVILVAAGLIALFTGESLVKVLALLGPVWDLASSIIAGILMLLFILLSPIFNALVNLLLKAVEQSNIEMPELLIDPVSEFQPGETLSGAPASLALYRPILTGLAVVIVVLIVALTLGRLWRARSRLGRVETQRVRGELPAAGQFTRRARSGLESLMGRLGLIGRWYTAASIRRIYAQMVALASRSGHPRADSETPFEYLETLVAVWPDLQAQLDVITEAYVQVHYGELPETEEELEVIRQAWFYLQSSMR